MTSPPAPRWSAPQAAFDEYQPGLSPYLHYFRDLRNSRESKEPPVLGPDAGADLPGQMERALRQMIEESLR